MKFSVIVPVFNAEKYINDCVSSLLSQSFDDYEIILVNDGSTDNSYNICKEFSTKFERIKLVNKENNGVGAARNTGIDNADGDYLIFVDSDDFLNENALQTYYDCFENSSTDLIISGYIQKNLEDNSSENHNYNSNWIGNIEVFTNNVFNDLFDNWLIHSPWNKAFKKSIIDKNTIRFSEDYCIYEDIGFVLDYIICCKNISVIPDKIYVYNVKNSGSLVTKYNENAYIAYLDCWSRIEKILDSVNAEKKLYDKYKLFLCSKIFSYIKDAFIHNKDDKTKFKKILSAIHNDKRYYEITKNVKLQKKHFLIENLLLKSENYGLLLIFLKMIY